MIIIFINTQLSTGTQFNTLKLTFWVRKKNNNNNKNNKVFPFNLTQCNVWRIIFTVWRINQTLMFVLSFIQCHLFICLLFTMQIIHKTNLYLLLYVIYMLVKYRFKQWPSFKCDNWPNKKLDAYLIKKKNKINLR